MSLARLCLALAMLGAGCKCPSQTLGPLEETPPADLAEKNLIVEQPASGDAKGAWVTVAGWFNPAEIQGVFVAGAPVEAFYVPIGHGTPPTVPVLARDNGRFIAPRVPLANGATTIAVIPISKGGKLIEPQKLELRVADADSVPATLVIDPAQPEPGKPARLRAAHAAGRDVPWQWDFDGDGTFEVEARAPEHAWAEAGMYEVTARTKIDGAWVAAYSVVTVGGPLKTTASFEGLQSPRRIFVLPRYSPLPRPRTEDGGYAEQDKSARYVAVTEADQVRIFDPQLAPLFTLTGLSSPSMVAADPSGRIYVADRGNDRVVRFTAAGDLDTSFANQGFFTGTADVPLKGPVAVALGPDEVSLLSAGGSEKYRCWTQPVGVDRTPLGDWKQLECQKDALSSVPGLAERGPTTFTHPILRPSHLFTGAAQHGATFFLSNGQLISADGFDPQDEPRDVVDAALSPTAFRADLAWVDSRGALHHAMTGQQVGVWRLSYPITAVASGPDGQLYVAGDGRIEGLEAPRLR